jgi:LacI family transcriptional regulator
VSLIGYDDAPLVEHLFPPLSTVRLTGERIGRVAGELAIALIEAPEREVASRTFPPELVARESTAPPRSRPS